MTSLRIGSHSIDPDHSTFVIAEIGVNHDGSLEKALALVHAAADAGADAIKLQIFHAQTLVHASTRLAAYQKEYCHDTDPVAMLRRYELSASDLRTVIDVAHSLGLIPLATPFSLPDVRTVADLALPAIKIASPDLVNLPLLRRAATVGRPLLISTGAATMAEVETTVNWLREWHAPFALLHCVSSYPTPPDQANLCWIRELTERFAVPVGFSDHTQEVLTGALAAAAGALVIEKHLTYDRTAEGPDHAASADPDQFSQYVSMVRQSDLLRGRPGKHILDIERDVRTVSRQSLVVGRDLHPGHVLHEDDLLVQRPGTGIPAGQLPAALGKKVTRSLRAGTLLQWDMLSDAA
jgi:N-acetylneuraminate synthase/N,N'-diacetyllegionaminate synthase